MDARGCPFFPAFLYDEKVMDGTSTKGVFRGPLLLKVGLVTFQEVPAHRHM